MRVLEWAEDEESVAAMEADPEAAGWARQCSLFDWDDGTGFRLHAFAFSLTFTATAPSGRTLT